jgi:hypothetical protein
MLHVNSSLPSPQKDAREIAPPIEVDIGQMVASFVGYIATGILEHQQVGWMTKETARRGREALCELIPFKLTIADFDAIARKYGMQALCAHLATLPEPITPNEEFIGRLIELGLGLLTGLLKKKMN